MPENEYIRRDEIDDIRSNIRGDVQIRVRGNKRWRAVRWLGGAQIGVRWSGQDIPLDGNSYYYILRYAQD